MGSRQPQPVTGMTGGPRPMGPPAQPAPQTGGTTPLPALPAGFNPASAPQTYNINQQPPMPPAGGGFFGPSPSAGGGSFGGPQPYGFGPNINNMSFGGPAGGRCPTCGK